MGLVTKALENWEKKRDEFNDSDYVKDRTEEWKRASAYNDRERAASQSSSNNGVDPHRQLQEELARKEAERKAAEEKKRKGLYDTVMEGIISSKDKADTATYKSAFELASAGGSDNYRDLGRSRSRQMSMADDAAIAANAINNNIQKNRATAFDEAVKAGAAKLKAEGYDKAANNLEEAGKLQEDAANMTRFLDAMNSFTELFKGIDL